MTRFSTYQWVYFTQLGDISALADACPDLTIILDHLGAPIGIGPWRESRAEVFNIWRAALADVAARPNVVVKLGELGMALAGFPFRKWNVPPSSLELSRAWHPYIDTAIALFGVDRAMFESNYPVDRSSGSYPTLWNAFKRAVPGASMTEKAALFAGTANRVYDLCQPPSTHISHLKKYFQEVICINRIIKETAGRTGYRRAR